MLMSKAVAMCLSFVHFSDTIFSKPFPQSKALKNKNSYFMPSMQIARFNLSHSIQTISTSEQLTLKDLTNYLRLI